MNILWRYSHNIYESVSLSPYLSRDVKWLTVKCKYMHTRKQSEKQKYDCISEIADAPNEIDRSYATFAFKLLQLALVQFSHRQHTHSHLDGCFFLYKTDKCLAAANELLSEVICWRIPYTLFYHRMYLVALLVINILALAWGRTCYIEYSYSTEKQIHSYPSIRFFDSLTCTVWTIIAGYSCSIANVY